ncbi:hypothetical protein IHE45_06G052500 [Dioscorea alata]|nr:hypothetical protein IHE45_06G052500 [Dioscorea alata]
MIVGPLHVKNSWWWSKEDNAWNLGLHKTSGCHGDTVNEADGNYEGSKSRINHSEKAMYAGRWTSLQCRPKS